MTPFPPKEKTEDYYYEAPPDRVFEDMKHKAVLLWGTYDDPNKTEKQTRIKDLQNVQDNFMYIFAMFDVKNQKLMGNMLNEETKEHVRDRLIAGGAPYRLLPF